MCLYTGVINGVIIKLRIAWFYKPGAYMGGGGAYIRGFTVLHDFFIRLF